MNTLEFDEHDGVVWICSEFYLRSRDEPIQVALVSENEPSKEYINRAFSILNSIDDLVSKAAPFILENYSYKYFKKLGIDEDLLLPEETPEAIEHIATLESVTFDEPQCKEFELSFYVPWDEVHLYSVIFEDGEPISCAVDG